MRGGRRCRQCSAVFVPRREHAQFCSRACRVAWNREQLGDVPVGPSVLNWAITAMQETIERLFRTQAWDRTRAFEAISDAVWRVTMVDAALVRYHPAVYDDMLDRLGPDDRASVEETLAGLRLVRNHVGEPDDLARFVDSATADWTPRAGQITDRRWNPVAAPPRSSGSPSGQDWELERYRAYQARLAGAAIGDTFERCTDFLLVTATRAVTKPHANASTGH